ncbi:DUF2938 domain-containing protein [Vulgatibacter incomptus]|uniref:DUF2938 domain-containing protein n=1 Tax=Vulgatibacter incomptus TaxID=1391653 RepID=UPI00196A18C6|nr:DUF2938 domain-containing protein [Vulgatibacter incomptus]
MYAASIGVGATALMDLWSLLLRKLGIRTLDLAMVGRWIGHFREGVFSHERIVAAAPVRGERALGWCAHYLIGISFAAVLVAGWGQEWAQRPTLFPALLVGLVTVLAPYLIMQPALGLGFFASKAPNPPAARLLSLLAHSIYGLGLYAAASLLAWGLR